MRLAMCRLNVLKPSLFYYWEASTCYIITQSQSCCVHVVHVVMDGCVVMYICRGSGVFVL